MKLKVFCFKLMEYNPFTVIGAGLLNVDMICAFYSALCLYFYFINEKHKGSLQGFYLFLSGLFLCVGYLHKETVLWCLPVIFILMCRNINRKYLFFIAGILSVLIFEFITIYILTGDPLTRWKILIGGPHHVHMANSYLQGISLQYHILAFFSALFNPVDKQVLYRGIYYLFTAIIIIYYIIKKEKLVRPLILWWTIPLVIAILGTNSLSSYVPMVQAEVRHVALVIFPAVLIIAHFIYKYSYKRSRFICVLSYSAFCGTYLFT